MKVFIFATLMLAGQMSIATDINSELLEASLKGDLNGVSASLSAGANPNYSQDSYTPLMGASNNGFTEIAKMLIEAGANVNAFRNGVCGYTAIWLAAYTGRNNIVSLLAQKGADINALGGCFSETPLKIAERYERHSTVKILKNLGGQ